MDVDDDTGDLEVSGTEAAQQNVGSQQEAGGGEFPDPDTPPKGPAPGTADPHAGPQEVGDGPGNLSGLDHEPDFREAQEADDREKR